ncbi:MAG: hypothetical protein V5B39_16035 [Accumulibacter sp.]|jgi:hypothetical protein
MKRPKQAYTAGFKERVDRLMRDHGIGTRHKRRDRVSAYPACAC